MPTETIFPTLIQTGNLKFSAKWNEALLKEIFALQKQDRLGQDWSKANYPNGYTSYASLSDLPFRTPRFSELSDALQPEAENFAKVQGWKLKGLTLRMDSCWMNIMPKHTTHSLHLHPHSVISGTYYVSTPPGSVALRLEDPRMPYYMAAPVREKKGMGLFHEVVPKPGAFVLFESWLRHEVPPNRSNAPRVSVSFNYSLESGSED